MSICQRSWQEHFGRHWCKELLGAMLVSGLGTNLEPRGTSWKMCPLWSVLYIYDSWKCFASDNVTHILFGNGCVLYLYRINPESSRRNCGR